MDEKINPLEFYEPEIEDEDEDEDEEDLPEGLDIDLTNLESEEA